jgi:hypothetical protein
MIDTNLDSLYALLPAVYRERDAQRNYQLRALLRIIAQQAALVDGDIQQLWNNLFIETCEPWVIPYIGDLVSNNLLYDGSRTLSPDTAKALFTDLAGKDLRPPVAARIRADVAKTIYYRRRKATLPMLEELARDVTGWPAHAVEFFELLGWTQFLEHLRFQSQWTDVRSIDRMERINGPFDVTSHSVDVRQPAQQEGWHNIRNLGFFFWRLASYPLANVPARPASVSWGYHFSPLGNPAPLFSKLRPEGDDAGLSTELHISGPIRRTLFFEDLDQYRTTPPPRSDFTSLYGLFAPLPTSTDIPSETSLFVMRNGQLVNPAVDPTAPLTAYVPQIVCRRLDPWPGTQPTGRIIAIDVEHGRLAVGDGWPDPTTAIDVWFHYGFSASLGGGPYDRRKWLVKPELAQAHYVVQEDGVAPVFPTLTAALAQWVTDRRPNAIVTIRDSRTYQLPASITLRNEGWLAIEAANRERPLLQTVPEGCEINVFAPAIPGNPDRNASLTLSGVVVEGFVHIAGDLAQLRLLHATLVPGGGLDENGDPVSTHPSLLVEPLSGTTPINTQLRVQAAFSIAGPLVVPEHSDSIWLLDSIADGVGGAVIEGPAATPGPHLIVERSTILGPIQVKELEASETIFAGIVDTVRTQQGCVRFCYVPPGSPHTPRRYRCQPDLAVQEAIDTARERDPSLSPAVQAQIRDFIQGWLVPAFTTGRYGQPAYAQLHLGAPREILTGAEDGSEMGAFCHLKQPQRESNLKIRLQEYLPFGLEAGIIYVT